MYNTFRWPSKSAKPQPYISPDVRRVRENRAACLCCLLGQFIYFCPALRVNGKQDFGSLLCICNGMFGKILKVASQKASTAFLAPTRKLAESSLLPYCVLRENPILVKNSLDFLTSFTGRLIQISLVMLVSP
jgi:hypothetical protein